MKRITVMVLLLGVIACQAVVPQGTTLADSVTQWTAVPAPFDFYVGQGWYWDSTTTTFRAGETVHSCRRLRMLTVVQPA